VVGIAPSISINKTASPISIYRGDEVTYTYNVSNTGSVSLTNITVIDDVLGDLTSNLPDTTLEVGESNTFEVTASPTVTVTNTVNATGTPPVGANVTASDTATVTVSTRPTPPGGGGPALRCPECQFDVDMLGEITTVRVTCCDSRVIETTLAPDPDDIHFLEFERGTTVVCDYLGRYPEVIVMSIAEESPPIPDGVAVIGPVYNFTGYYGTGYYVYKTTKCCSAVDFGQPISMVLNYDPDEVPENATSLAVAYYDTEQGYWVDLPPDTGHVAEIGKATGLIDHFSTIAILAELAPPPAHFVASDLNIVLSQEKIWEPITFVTRTGKDATITANVANDGEREGTYIVELKINGETVDAKEVTLDAGQSQQVSFTLSGMDYGQYEVEVAELSGEFDIFRSINWWLIIGIIAAVGLITWGVIWGRSRRKKAVESE
jgi:uncharacterized repeat protein (TIGR01451 family)